jgi:hypothetical protein
MGPIDCPETSVRNYQYSLRNNTEKRSSQLRNVRVAIQIRIDLYVRRPHLYVCMYVGLQTRIWNTQLSAQNSKTQTEQF